MFYHPSGNNPLILSIYGLCSPFGLFSPGMHSSIRYIQMVLTSSVAPSLVPHHFKNILSKWPSSWRLYVCRVVLRTPCKHTWKAGVRVVLRTPRKYAWKADVRVGLRTPRKYTWKADVRVVLRTPRRYTFTYVCV